MIVSFHLFKERKGSKREKLEREDHRKITTLRWRQVQYINSLCDFFFIHPFPV